MFYRLLRETEEKGKFSLEIKDDTTQHEEPQTFEQFNGRQIIKNKFRYKVDDHWTVAVDPDQIKETLVHNHNGDEWYRTAPLYWIGVNHDDANIFVLNMICSDGTRAYQFTEAYKRSTDS
jgi:hypothetical protein